MTFFYRLQWLSGAIHDWTGSYREAFWVAQSTTLASVIFIWIAGGRERERN